MAANEPPPDWQSAPWIISDASSVKTATPPVVLGRGALGEVHAATYKDRPVAVKRLFLLSETLEGGAISAQERLFVLQTLHKECSILARLHSDYIVQFIGTTLTPNGEPSCIIMEHLRSFKKVYQLPLDRVSWVAVMTDIWCGLEALETHAIVHRDLKPDNLLVAGDGHVKLGDLGEARAGLTLPGTQGRGTLLYMPPETRQAGRTLSPACDRFTAVVVAIELALGEAPNPTAENDLSGRMIDEIDRRRSHVTAFNVLFPWASTVFERALANEPSRRPLLRELRRATLVAPGILLEAQQRVSSNQDVNTTGKRALDYVFAESAVSFERVALPRVGWRDMHHFTNDDGETWHTYNGSMVDVELCPEMDEVVIAQLERYCQLQDPRWQRIEAICLDPSAIIRGRCEGNPLTSVSKESAIAVLVEVGHALHNAHAAGIYHGGVDSDHVAVLGRKSVQGVCLAGGGATRNGNVHGDVTDFIILVYDTLEASFPSRRMLDMVKNCFPENSSGISMRDAILLLINWVPRLEIDDAPYSPTPMSPERELERDDAASKPVEDTATRTPSPVSDGDAAEGVLDAQTTAASAPADDTPATPIVAAGTAINVGSAEVARVHRVLVEEIFPLLVTPSESGDTDKIRVDLACDMLEYLLTCRAPEAEGVIMRWSQELVLSLIAAKRIDRCHDLCAALLFFCDKAADNVTSAVVEIILCAADECIATGMPHAAAFLAAKQLSEFTHQRSTLPDQVSRITAHVFRALQLTTSKETEMSTYTIREDSPHETATVASGRSASDILKAMVFAAYRPTHGARNDFSWEQIYRLELEFMLATPVSFAALRDLRHVARQRRDKASAFIDHVISMSDLFSRAGLLVAASQMIVFILELAIFTGSEQFLRCLEAYARLVLAVASKTAVPPAVSPRERLHEARCVVVQALESFSERVLPTQATFTTAVVSIVRDMIAESLSQMGPPPCRLAFLGLGSMANAAMSLYSDLEFALVTSEPFQPEGETKRYVTRLVQLINLKIVALGETPPIPGNIHYVQGLSFDSGGNTPLGKEPPLAGTPEELAHQLGVSKGGDLIVVGVLSAPCLIAGDESLFSDFCQVVARTLGGQETGSLRVRHGLRLLEETVTFRVSERFNVKGAFDAKKVLYRMPALALNALALLFEIPRTAAIMPLPEVVARLLDTKALDPRVADAFVRALEMAARMRLTTHAHYETECDTIVALPATNGMLALTPELQLMFAQTIYETVIPLGQCIADFLSRLRSVEERRVRGVQLDLETCTDATRFFGAKIFEKMAAVSNINVAVSIQIAIGDCISQLPLDMIPPSVVAWMKRNPVPDLSNASANIAAKRNELTQIMTDLDRLSGLDGLALAGALRELYQELDAFYESFLKNYNKGDDARRRQTATEMNCQIVGCISGARYFRAKASNMLFDDNGTFQNTENAGQHDVNRRVPGLHFKRDPSFPSVEYAVSLLGFLLDNGSVGRLSPPVEILRVIIGGKRDYTLIASQTVTGTPLHLELRTNPAILDLWRPAHFSMTFILALLVCPEDGKPDNFVVVHNRDADGTAQSVDVVSVDNDHSFVEAFTKVGVLLKSERLFIKSIIFCCNQMLSPLDNRVRKSLRQLTAGTVLRFWLLALHRSNTAIRSMFSSRELQAAFNNGDGSCIPFLMSIPILKELYERLARLLELLNSERVYTHLALLTQIGGAKIGSLYAAELKRDKSPLDRFLSLTKESYQPRKQGTGQTLTTAAAMFSSNLRLPNVRGVTLDAPEFSVERALESLQLMDAVREEFLVDHAVRELHAARSEAFVKLAVVPLQEKVLARVDWNIVWAFPRVTDAIKAVLAQSNILHFSLIERRAANLESVSLATVEILRSVSLDRLVSLNLTNTAITNWDSLASRCASLRVLRLKDSYVADSFLNLQTGLEFPCLEILDFRGIRNLNQLSVPRRTMQIVIASQLWLSTDVRSIMYPTPLRSWTESIVVVSHVPSARFLGTPQVAREIWNITAGHPLYDNVVNTVVKAVATPTVTTRELEQIVFCALNVMHSPILNEIFSALPMRHQCWTSWMTSQLVNRVNTFSETAIGQVAEAFIAMVCDLGNVAGVWISVLCHLRRGSLLFAPIASSLSAQLPDSWFQDNLRELIEVRNNCDPLCFRVRRACENVLSVGCTESDAVNLVKSCQDGAIKRLVVDVFCNVLPVEWFADNIKSFLSEVCRDQAALPDAVYKRARAGLRRWVAGFSKISTVDPYLVEEFATFTRLIEFREDLFRLLSETFPEAWGGSSVIDALVDNIMLQNATPTPSNVDIEASEAYIASMHIKWSLLFINDETTKAAPFLFMCERLLERQNTLVTDFVLLRIHSRMVPKDLDGDHHISLRNVIPLLKDRGLGNLPDSHVLYEKIAGGAKLLLNPSDWPVGGATACFAGMTALGLPLFIKTTLNTIWLSGPSLRWRFDISGSMNLIEALMTIELPDIDSLIRRAIARVLLGLRYAKAEIWYSVTHDYPQLARGRFGPFYEKICTMSNLTDQAPEVMEAELARMENWK